MLFLQLFYTFFKIGLFGFGGGYAMLSMIQGEVVTRYGWLTSQEFTDIVAISQMTPGPIGINSGNLCRVHHDSGALWHKHGSVGIVHCYLRRSASLVHPDAHYQQILSEIPKASGGGSRIQRTSSCRSGIVGIGGTGLDE